MDSTEETYLQLVRTLTLSSSFLSTSDSPSIGLQKSTAELHAAALQSVESATPHLEFLSQTLSSLALPGPITLHPTPHSANSQAILSHLKNANPSILHVHSPAYKPSFPHHLHCTESYLPLSSHTEAASLITSSLRDAVAARKPVTIIVVHLDATNSLLPALTVAHALADRFDARVHVTGPGCVSAFLGETLAVHSVGLDVGRALAVRGCGYITFGVEAPKSDYGDGLLPFSICMRYVLQKFPPSAIKEVLDGVARVVEGLSDALYRVEALWQMDVLAKGEARIRYVGEGGKEVEEHVVAHDGTRLLELRDRILISATSALQMNHAPPVNAVKGLCELLIRVARQYELATLARSAFTARLRQCEHVEVQPGEGMALCTLSVVPLGHVPPAGRWRTDEDARSVVTECTKIFAKRNAEEQEIAVIMNDDGNENESSAVLSPKLCCVIADDVDDRHMAEECERLAQELDFNEESARSWGIRVAEGVVYTVLDVVETMVVAGGGDVCEEFEDVEEESKREPDGTVEVVEEIDSQQERESDQEVHTDVAKLNHGSDGDHAFKTSGERALDREKRDERPEEHAESDKHAKTRIERATQNGATRPKSRSGLWGLIFGDKDSAETESDESSEDVEGKQLEDDYFRP